MKITTTCLAAVLAAAATGPLLFPCNAKGADTPKTGESTDLQTFWESPLFQNQFLGTYGVKSDIEPLVTSTEREELESVLALMGTPKGQAQAKAILYKTTTPGHSGTFDFTLGNIYFQEEKLEFAAAWYKSAINKFPGFLRAHKNLGIVSVRLEKYDEALPALTKAIELGARDGLTFGMLGYAYAMEEKDISAESAYRQAMMLQPNTIDWQLGLARSLFRQKKYEEAATLCAELISKDASRADYWLLEANAFLGLRQPLTAAVNYEYLMRLGKLPASAMNSLGDIYVNEGLCDLAADVYTNLLASVNEPDVNHTLRNAEVLAMRNAPAAAHRVLKALSERVGDAGLPVETKKRALKLEAKLAALEERPGEEQVALLESIVKVDPLDGETLIALGRHYASTGELERGVFYFERAAGIEACEAEACLRQGQALARAGRFADALPLLKRANDLTPRDSLTRYIEQVERVSRAKR